MWKSRFESLRWNPLLWLVRLAHRVRHKHCRDRIAWREQELRRLDARLAELWEAEFAPFGPQRVQLAARAAADRIRDWESRACLEQTDLVRLPPGVFAAYYEAGQTRPLRRDWRPAERPAMRTL